VEAQLERQEREEEVLMEEVDGDLQEMAEQEEYFNEQSKESQEDKQGVKREVEFKVGRIERSIEAWKKYTTNTEVLETVRGIVIRTLTPVPRMRANNMKMGEEEEKAIDLEIEKMLKREVVEEVNEDELWVVSQVFAVRQLQKYRVVYNLKPLNQYIGNKSIKYTTLMHLRDMVRDMKWGAVIDCRAGYTQLRVDEASRPLLGFSWRGKFWRLKRLCFGLCTAPRIYSKAMQVVVDEMRRRGFVISSYIDDVAIFSETREKCRKGLKELMELMDEIGWILNTDKTQWPSQKPLFRGLVWELDDKVISLKKDFVRRLVGRIDGLLRRAVRTEQMLDRREMVREERLRRILMYMDCRGVEDKVEARIRKWRREPDYLEVRARELASVLGGLEWSRIVDPAAKAYLRESQALLGSETKRSSWRTTVVLGRGSIVDLKILRARLLTRCKRPMRDGASKVLLEATKLTTDASGSGYGARAELGNGVVLEVMHFFTEEEAQEPIHIKEGISLIRLLEAIQRNYLHVVENKRLAIHTDSAVVVETWRHWAGRDLRANLIIKKIHALVEEMNIELDIHHIRGEDNVAADLLSRVPKAQEYSIQRTVFNDVLTHFGVDGVDIDLFASNHLRVSQVFYSRAMVEESSGVDALLQRWEGVCWCMPPLGLLRQALVAWKEKWCERVDLLLVVPEWRQAEWWRELGVLATGWYYLGKPWSWVKRLLPGQRVEVESNSSWEYWVALLEARSASSVKESVLRSRIS